MSDPIKDLEDFGSEGTPMTPLAPSEVRRRGDRIRRRRNAVVAAGSALAVGVIATTGFVVAGNADHPRNAGPATTTSEDASDGSSPAGPAKIPAGFPLDDGVQGGQITHRNALSKTAFCGDRPLRGVDAADVQSAELVGGDADFVRTLYLFDSPQEAQRLHEAVVTSARQCPDPDPENGTVSLWDTDPEAWPGNTIVHEYADEPTTEPSTQIIHVVTKGSAVLVSSTFGAWSADQQSGVMSTRSEMAGVVAAMDSFGSVPDGLPVPFATTDGP